MKVKNFLIVLIIGSVINTLFASVYKGQKEYMKKCKSCHGVGSKISMKYTTQQWEEFFANDGQKLVKIHEKKDVKYFLSDRFKKKKKHLLDFFKKFSADSGNVPACSD